MEGRTNHTEQDVRSRDSRGSLGSVLLGLMTGALAGAAAGLLFAPRAGEETQAKIRRRGEELRDQAEHKLELGREQAGSSVRKARMGVAGWLQQGSELLEEQATQLRENPVEERVIAG